MESYKIEGSLAKAKIVVVNSMPLYLVEEPRMLGEEKKLYFAYRKALKYLLKPSDVKSKNLEEVFEEYLRKASKKLKLPLSDKVAYYLKRDMLGAGRIDPLMKDSNIEEISVNGPKTPVFVWHRRHGSLKTNVCFESDEEIQALISRLAYLSNKYVSIANPILDATLPDGSRLLACYTSEVSRRGSNLTIRKFRRNPFSIIELIELGTLNFDLAAYLWTLVEERSSIIIAGDIAGGKTTLLNALATLIHPMLKVVTIEETAELNLPRENWISSVSRTSFYSVKTEVGEITLFSLLKAALRQRPDYIIVGEVRGEEAYVLFQAMATGHLAMCTLHADSSESVVKRLSSPPMNIPPANIAMIDAILVMKKYSLPDGRHIRRVNEVTEVKEYVPEENRIELHPVFVYDVSSDEYVQLNDSYVLKKVPEQKVEKKKTILKWAYLNNVRDHRSFARLLMEYYLDPEKLYKKAAKEVEVRLVA